MSEHRQEAEGALFEPFRLGRLEQPNRIVMAPLTRNRAGEGNVPGPLAARYYQQRASAGLLITEASQISPEGQGYQATPGIHSPEQIAGWRHVTDAVHANGGRIFIQLWHVGRVSHVALQPGRVAPVAPSAIAANTKTFVNGAFVETSAPRALRLDEIAGVVADYRKAAANAIAAGFDGIEIHAANGYLIDQFLRDSANRREDAYGGPIENRARFLLEVLAASIAEVGGDRVGIRLSPVTPSNDIADSDPQALFGYLIAKIDALKPVYVHVVEGATGGDRDFGQPFDYGALRRAFHGAYIANNGYTGATAAAAVTSGAADLVAFGKAFIANPDLVERLRRGAPLNAPDVATFYGGGAEGYTDYPTLG
ncbi:alkene reductase [Blastochloris viridis]|uniref:N-ethylmaleimide reductase n=1 Tax=Blastochloris viridis TaxID=1079 RepID=A0A0H5BAX8_BLAVI|nr:alkene reductase [Blastochloris viridis]ALK10653.1 N-ethylmaleimide reductase [Blastochloris viridis]BAR99387.1 NADH:flavin oxidoreductases [Blastochloris viridis]CUU43316.1 N-ethylmaleimide reductase [Blastochloris viridis]